MCARLRGHVARRVRPCAMPTARVVHTRGRRVPPDVFFHAHALIPWRSGASDEEDRRKRAQLRTRDTALPNEATPHSMNVS